MEKLCRSECQIILWGLQPGYLAANELHIFLFTNRREVNSPWWVIQIAAAPVSLHSSLYCFPQAKVSEYLVSFLCCGVYIHESLEGLQLYPGSVAQGAASGVCSPLPAPVGEKIEGLRSCSGARAGAGDGRSAPSWPMTLFSHPFPHCNGKGLRLKLHPEMCVSCHCWRGEDIFPGSLWLFWRRLVGHAQISLVLLKDGICNPGVGMSFELQEGSKPHSAFV